MKLRLLHSTRFFHSLCLLAAVALPGTTLTASAVNSEPTNAVGFTITGFGGIDTKALARLRLAIGQAISENTVDRYTISQYTPDGGFTGCIQASSTSSAAKFQKVANRLLNLKYDFRTTAYSAEYKLRCAQLPAASFQRITVYKPDGTKQCESIPAIPVEVMQSELENQGIGVYAADHVLDGGFHAQVCGGNTGYINRYSIAQSDLGLAQSLGFRTLGT